MTGMHSLPALMTDLLQQLGLRAPLPRDDCYTLHFDDGLPVYLLAGSDGLLDILAEAGSIGNVRDSDLLLDLLAMNGEADSALAATVSVHRANGAVVVGLRQHLQGLDTDGLRLLLDAVRRCCARVRQRIACPALPARTGNGGAWARLLPRT